MVLFPPPFRFVFDISNLLSYIQNISRNELARPVMGTILLVYICACDCRGPKSLGGITWPKRTHAQSQ